jgi:hypothetical protein
MAHTRPFALGRARSIESLASPAPNDPPYALPAHHLVTHGVVVGMTGSGKTGLCVGIVEEAARSGVPVLLIDIKGDLPNLALTFDQLDGPSFAPWIDPDSARRRGKKVEELAEETARRWREGLAGWGLSARDSSALRARAAIRVITPGTSSGESLHVLSPLEVPTDLWEVDEEAAREALSASISLLLRMVKRDPDPTRGREHVLLAHLAERRLRAGQAAGLETLLSDLQAPPIARLGALSVDEFLPPKERASLATDLNALIASPTFASWRRGAPLDVGSWLERDDDRVPITIVSVAHLEDEERQLVLGLVLEQALAWVRGLPGTSDLRAMILFDEVFGFLPPHPSNPPTKRPLLALLKQARAFGVGCVLATQNPIDLDYKALSNAGVWFVGRLQTDADRARVVEGLVGSEAGGGGAALDAQDLAAIIKALPPRTFFVRDVHAGRGSTILETRWTLSWLRGPMTRREIRRLATDALLAAPAPAFAPAPAPAPAPALAPAPAPAPARPEAPAPPEGWKTLFPHPPSAPVDAWSYHPYAAIIARAEIVDARLSIRFTREVGIFVPIDGGTLDLDRAVPFDPDVLAKGRAVPGARFLPYAEAPLGARAVRALEKSLRELAFSALRTSVTVNEPLGLVAAPGEDARAFTARCAHAAQVAAAKVRAEILQKHDPRIARLAAARDAAHRALSSQESPLRIFTGDKPAVARARKEAAEAQAALDEAVRKRDAELLSKEGEVLRAPAESRPREIAPKKDALVVESYAIVWVAG